jgi:HlyD family secretion protein
VRAGARSEEIREAEEQVAAARAVDEGARRVLGSARQLYEDRLPARQRRDAAHAERHSATAAVAAARAHLALLRRGTRAEVRQRLRAQEAEARAALAVAESQRQDMEIRTPAGGVVSARSVEPGEVVLPGTRLLEITDVRSIWARVYLPQKEYGRVRVGDRATVTTDSLPGRMFRGRARAIAQEAEYTPRSVQTKEVRVHLMFAIRVDVENAGGALRIGMPVDVSFP